MGIKRMMHKMKWLKRDLKSRIQEVLGKIESRKHGNMAEIQNLDNREYSSKVSAAEKIMKKSWKVISAELLWKRKYLLVKNLKSFLSCRTKYQIPKMQNVHRRTNYTVLHQLMESDCITIKKLNKVYQNFYPKCES